MQHHINNYPIEGEQYVFIHVPKCGGTSIHSNIKDDRVIGQNFHLFVNPNKPPETHNYFTFLRAPVERVWSYHHMCLKHDSYWLGLEKNIKVLLDRCWEVKNTMCFIFSGAECGDYYHQVFFNGGVISDFDMSQIYNKALENLMHFKVVGFLDKYTEGWEQIKQIINVEDGQEKNVNTSYNRDIPPEISNLITQNNLWDIQLYNQIKEINE